MASFPALMDRDSFATAMTRREAAAALAEADAILAEQARKEMQKACTDRKLELMGRARRDFAKALEESGEKGWHVKNGLLVSGTAGGVLVKGAWRGLGVAIGTESASQTADRYFGGQEATAFRVLQQAIDESDEDFRFCLENANDPAEILDKLGLVPAASDPNVRVVLESAIEMHLSRGGGKLKDARGGGPLDLQKASDALVDTWNERTNLLGEFETELESWVGRAEKLQDETYTQEPAEPSWLEGAIQGAVDKEVQVWRRGWNEVVNSKPDLGAMLGSTIVGIAQNADRLGIDPKTAKLLTNVIAARSAGLSAMRLAASGNYVGAALSVLSVFGKQRPSPQMVALGQVLAGLRRIEGRLQRIEERLDEIHRDLASKLDRNFEAILDNREILNDLQYEPFVQLSDFIKRREALRSWNGSYFASYSDREEHYRIFGGKKFTNGTEKIEGYFSFLSAREQAHSVFKVSSSEEGAQEKVAVTAAALVSAVKLFDASGATPKELRFLPTKITALHTESPSVDLDEGWHAPMKSKLDELLDRNRVLEAARLALEVHDTFQLLKQPTDTELMTVDELLSNAKFDRLSGPYFLQGSARMLDLLFAQGNLLNGTPLLRFLVDISDNNPTPPPVKDLVSARRCASDLLVGSVPTLLNLTLLIVSNGKSTMGWDSFSYEVFRNLPKHRGREIRAFMGPDLPIVWIPERTGPKVENTPGCWGIDLGFDVRRGKNTERAVSPLPTGTDLERGLLHVFPFLRKVQHEYQRTIGAIREYEFATSPKTALLREADGYELIGLT